MASDNLHYINQLSAELARLQEVEEVAFDQNELEIYDEPMSAPTREEIDAKLETIEVKMDGRLAIIERGIASMEASAKETRAEFKSLKWTIVLTGLSTVLGIAAFNSTVFSNMVASFESGKNTAKDQAEVRKQVEDTAELLKQIKADIEAKKAAEKQPRNTKS